MDKKRSSTALKRNAKARKTPENEKVFAGFHSPVSNKSTSLYKSVLKDSVGKQTSNNHSKVRFSMGESIKESPRERRTSEEYDFHCSFDSDEENIGLNTPFSCTQPVSQDAVLQGVVAYIEARSNTENRFEGISKQMELLGAVVVKKFISEVTHVIFKDGKKSTREKAVKKGIHLVNVLWVESCRQSGKRVDEDLFPVVVPDEVHTPLVTGKLKRTKSMQPRSFEDDVRNSAERMNRKKQRKIASERTPTSMLSPLTRRLLSEDSQTPACPLVSSSINHVPDTPVYSGSNSPDQQKRETELPKRLDFEESSSAKKASRSSKCLKTVDTPVDPPSSASLKTPVSPKTVPTDILQTASGPGKKRKRLQSSKESTSSEPDEKPKQNKKNKPTNALQDTDVFTFDEEEAPEIKTSKLKRTRKSRSKSTGGVENKIEKDSSSVVCEDELENDLRANSLTKTHQGKKNPKQEDAQLNNNQSPSSTRTGRGSGSRDAERELDILVGTTGLSDSGISFSEAEMQEKKTKVLKKNKKFKKTEKIVGEVVSTENENEVEDIGKTSNPIKYEKRNETLDKNPSGAKRGKKSVPRKKKEKKTELVTSEEDQNLPNGACKTTEDEGKNVKKIKPQKTLKNGLRKQKRVCRNELEDSDEDDNIDNDGDECADDDDGGNGDERNISRSRKKYVRRTIPEDTDDDDDEDDVDDDGDDDHMKNISPKTTPVLKKIQVDTDDDDNDDDGDDDDNHMKKISRKNTPARKKISDDDDNDNHDNVDDGNGMTEDDDDESEINDGDDSEENISHKTKETKNIAKQKPKEKNTFRKKPSRSLVLTSMHFSEQDIVISVVRKLGGFYIADTVGPSTTHVISGSARRTLNVLMAIAQGNWLVSPEWVMKSLETGYWVDEEPYELAEAFPSAQLSRLERVSSGPDYRQELFADVDGIFVSENTSPPRDALIQLITNCGGKICTSIRKAGVVVGANSRKTKAINVTERWVLDSITEHTALSFNPYVFNPTKSTSPTF